MKHQRRPNPRHIACGALTTLALIAIGYRVERAIEWSLTDAITSISTVVLMIAAGAAGWRIHALKLRTRAERAEQENVTLQAHQRRFELRRDAEYETARLAEEQAWWDMHPDVDTIAFGGKVIRLDRHRSTKSA